MVGVQSCCGLCLAVVCGAVMCLALVCLLVLRYVVLCCVMLCCMSCCGVTATQFDEEPFAEAFGKKHQNKKLRVSIS